MQALKISTAGAVERIDIPSDDSLATLQRAVGGYIEIIALSRGVDLVINDEGKVYGLDHNSIANVLTHRFGAGLRAGDFIVGDVVIKGTDDEGATAEIDSAVFAEIERMAAELAAAFAATHRP